MVEGSWRGAERKEDTDLLFPMSKRPNSPVNLFVKKGVDFNRLKRQGRRIQTPMFNLMWLERPEAGPRVGIIVGRRLGKAVLRNRAKRIFRELARTTRMEFVNGREFLIFPKRKAVQSQHSTIRGVWRAALTEAGLITEKDSSFGFKVSG